VTTSFPIADFGRRAADAARMMKALANERRLMILCNLIAAGEMTVGELVEEIGLSQSALSQHLARLREDGLVTFRREAQTLWYRIADPDAERVIGVLRDLYCPTDGPKPDRRARAG
jgi:ArsR family transcriptional regulator